MIGKEKKYNGSTNFPSFPFFTSGTHLLYNIIQQLITDSFTEIRQRNPEHQYLASPYQDQGHVRYSILMDWSANPTHHLNGGRRPEAKRLVRAHIELRDLRAMGIVRAEFAYVTNCPSITLSSVFMY